MKRVLLFALISAAIHSGIKAQTTPSTSCMFVSTEAPVAEIRACAVQGDARNQYNLGYIYDLGNKGVPEDDLRAVRWYLLAANQGRADAQNNLGLMYFNGEGVSVDLVQAYMWLNLATAQDSSYQANKDLIEKSMTRQQIAEGQIMTREWLARRPPE